MKKNILAFIVACGVITTSNGMIVPELEPCVQIEHPKVTQWRKEEKFLPHIACVDTIKENNEGYRCLQYALKQTTGFINHIDFCGDRRFDIPINHFFEQTQNPQSNDLVVYTTKEDGLEARHFAVYIDEATYESKFGSNGGIYRHRPFDVPVHYGIATWHFTLKSEYKDDQNKLLSNLRKAQFKQQEHLIAFNDIENRKAGSLTSLSIGCLAVALLIDRMVD